MAKIDFNITDWLTVGVKANFLSSHSWGQSANIRYAMWYTPLSYVYARQPGYESWYNSLPDEKTASPFIGSGTNDSYAYTDRQSRSMNLNGVAYAQVDVPFIPGLSYKVTFQGQRNAGYGDVYNNPEMNVIFLTAYPDYSLQAWKTHACGFLVKPLVEEDIRLQLSLLPGAMKSEGAT